MSKTKSSVRGAAATGAAAIVTVSIGGAGVESVARAVSCASLFAHSASTARASGDAVTSSRGHCWSPSLAAHARTGLSPTSLSPVNAAGLTLLSLLALAPTARASDTDALAGESTSGTSTTSEFVDASTARAVVLVLVLVLAVEHGAVTDTAAVGGCLLATGNRIVRGLNSKVKSSLRGTGAAVGTVVVVVVVVAFAIATGDGALHVPAIGAVSSRRSVVAVTAGRGCSSLSMDTDGVTGTLDSLALPPRASGAVPGSARAGNAGLAVVLLVLLVLLLPVLPLLPLVATGSAASTVDSDGRAVLLVAADSSAIAGCGDANEPAGAGCLLANGIRIVRGLTSNVKSSGWVDGGVALLIRAGDATTGVGRVAGTAACTAVGSPPADDRGTMATNGWVGHAADDSLCRVLYDVEPLPRTGSIIP